MSKDYLLHFKVKCSLNKFIAYLVENYDVEQAATDYFALQKLNSVKTVSLNNEIGYYPTKVLKGNIEVALKHFAEYFTTANKKIKASWPLDSDDLRDIFAKPTKKKKPTDIEKIENILTISSTLETFHKIGFYGTTDDDLKYNNYVCYYNKYGYVKCKKISEFLNEFLSEKLTSQSKLLIELGRGL